jgi:hypothetical protein
MIISGKHHDFQKVNKPMNTKYHLDNIVKSTVTYI